MKRYFTVFTAVAVFSLLAVLAFERCSKSSNNSNTTNYLQVTLIPGSDATLKLGKATLFFPGEAIRRQVTATVRVSQDKSSLPHGLTTVTDIYWMQLSDPEAYDEDVEGSVQFSVANPSHYSVWSSYWKYGVGVSREYPRGRDASLPAPWYKLGGTVSGNTIEAPIPKNSGSFVVGAMPGDTTSTVMRKGPFLMLNGDPGSMTVQWEAGSSCTANATLAWGATFQSDPANYPSQAQVTGDHNLFFSKKIDGLIPSARTYYAVTINQTGSTVSQSYPGSFLTPPPDDADSVTFYAYGDTRSYPVDHNRVLHYLNEDAKTSADTRQTFLLHAGDFCSRGLEEKKWDGEFFYYRLHESTNEVLATFPFMGTAGNHEFYINDPPGHPTYRPPAQLYKYYWNYPMYPNASATHYSFDYGPVHVVSLDVYDEQYGTTSEQYQWLANDLLGSSKPWKIVMFHHPAYSASIAEGDNGYASTSAIRQNLSPLLENPQYGVSLVIAGHIHYYARAINNGLNYLTLGGGGAGLVSASDPNEPYVVTWAEQYSFARIEAGDTVLSVTVFNANDTTYLQQIDHVDIPK